MPINLQKSENMPEEKAKKFNLSKNDGILAVPSPTKDSGGDKLKYVLIFLVLAAVSAWYFVGSGDSKNSEQVGLTENASTQNDGNLSSGDQPTINNPADGSKANANPVSTDNQTSAPANTTKSVPEVSGSVDVKKNVQVPVYTFPVNGAAVISENSEMKNLLNVLSQNQNLLIELIGHTDSDGDEGLNLQLSTLRAKAFRDFLISNGISAERITITGKGESEPIADNNIASGKAKNRRVEYILK